MQILEDGRLTDGHGRTVDFRNTLVIMTSNLGTAEASRRSAGFATGGRQSDESRLRASVDDALRSAFRPEFLNRLDETIVFDPLSMEQVRRIVDLLLEDTQSRLQDHGVSIYLTDEALDWLADVGFDRKFGARPLRRAIQQHIENPLSKSIISGEYTAGDVVHVDASEDGLAFSRAGVSQDEAA